MGRTKGSVVVLSNGPTAPTTGTAVGYMKQQFIHLRKTQQKLVANCWKTSREHNIIDNRYIGKDRILHYDHEGAETPITVSPQEEEAPFKVVIVGSPNVVRISSRAPFQPTDNLMQ
eukprot:GEZU01026105.1.p2 GENE.GEZU01026105.1~~GEZU01026105.1.p2  ORF type:complete len:116 (+),score=12.62 GEZU01026105.1:148-495(+)